MIETNLLILGYEFKSDILKLTDDALTIEIVLFIESEYIRLYSPEGRDRWLKYLKTGDTSEGIRLYAIALCCPARIRTREERINWLVDLAVRIKNGLKHDIVSESYDFYIRKRRERLYPKIKQRNFLKSASKTDVDENMTENLKKELSISDLRRHHGIFYELRIILPRINIVHYQSDENNITTKSNETIPDAEDCSLETQRVAEDLDENQPFEDHFSTKWKGKRIIKQNFPRVKLNTPKRHRRRTRKKSRRRKFPNHFEIPPESFQVKDLPDNISISEKSLCITKKKFYIESTASTNCPLLDYTKDLPSTSNGIYQRCDIYRYWAKNPYGKWPRNTSNQSKVPFLRDSSK